jgi:hypothetical protein
LALLHHTEVIPPHRRDEQRGFKRRPFRAIAAVIVHEVEKLLRRVADAVQKRLVGGGEPVFTTPVAAAMQLRAALEEFAKVVSQV